DPVRDLFLIVKFQTVPELGLPVLENVSHCTLEGVTLIGPVKIRLIQLSCDS
ncbi:hypothetical protein P7K49_024656, partial [Saguinus oedipus]